MKTFQLLVIITILSCVSVSFAWQGKVVKIADGDTVTVLDIDKKQIRVRLWGIDAPESKQPFGTKSKQFLSKLIFGQIVDIEGYKADQYGRILGKVYLDHQYINLMMVQSGLAWHYKSYAPKDADLAQAQSLATKQELGLWSDPKPVPPWQFRATKKKAPSNVKP